MILFYFDTVIHVLVRGFIRLIFDNFGRFECDIVPGFDMSFGVLSSHHFFKWGFVRVLYRDVSRFGEE